MDCDNGSHQYPDIEVTLATTEFEGETKHDANVDFVDDENVSVQNVVCHGNKLRSEKPRRNEVVTLKIAPLESYVKKRRVRKSHLESSNNNKRPKTFKCPCARPNSVASNTSYSRISRTNFEQTKAKKGKRCPLRIAELAVPKKRQCIETWREKSDVLPGFMVERLKQQVMEQIPIAKIPEAIYCFRNEKRVKSKT